jgi:hypothetical protein
MVTGGYCPGTAVASIATGKLDALVFIGGFLIGSLVFGDFFPVWGNFYDSNYLGTFRLDQWLGIGLGPMVFILIVVAVAGSLTMLAVSRAFWPRDGKKASSASFLKLQAGLIATALAIGMLFAFFPTGAFIDDSTETPYYIIPKARLDVAATGDAS